MTFHFKTRRLTDWYDFGVELGRLNQHEAELLKLLDVLDGPQLYEVQSLLNRTASTKAKIVQMEKDWNAE